MKHIVIIISLFLALILIAETDVTGAVSGRWNRRGSPYNIMSDNVYIPDGDTLEIRAGVIVRIAEGCDFEVSPGGCLLANGTEESNIIFERLDEDEAHDGIYIYAADSNTIMKHCIISGAREFNLFLRNSPVTLDHCEVFDGGTSVFEIGGGIYAMHSDAKISYCDIHGNIGSTGSGIRLYNSDCLVENNLITDNTAERGGGLYISESRVIVGNNTIYNNTAEFGAGIYSVHYSYATIYNTIFKNYPDMVSEIEILDLGERIEILNCWVDSSRCNGDDIIWRNTNVFSEPLFDDGMPGMYWPNSRSELVNGGVASYTSILDVFSEITIEVPEYDFWGNDRIRQGWVDIGISESDYYRDPDSTLSDTTYICGEVSGTWNIDDSPYFLTCSCYVSGVNDLYIMPGVEVIAIGDASLNVVSGARLFVDGEEDDSVRFILENPISFENGSMYSNISFASILIDAYSNCAISIFNTDSITINNCEVTNSSSGNGFGIRMNESTGLIAYNYLHDLSGFGAMEIDDSQVEMRSNLIVNNQGSYEAGAIAVSNSDILSVNNTFAGNETVMNGGAFYLESSDLMLVNTLLFGNESGFGANDIHSYGMSNITVSHSLYYYHRVTGDISVDYLDITMEVDPAFRDSSIYGLISDTSRAIDMGTSSLDSVTWFDQRIRFPSRDVFGNSRPVGDGIDIGAYEVQAVDSFTSDTTFICGNVSGTWTAENSPYMLTCTSYVRGDDYLNIDPGVEIIIPESYTFNIIDGGSIIANGNEDDSIRFIMKNNIVFDDADYLSYLYYTQFKSSLLSYVEECLVKIYDCDYIGFHNCDFTANDTDRTGAIDINSSTVSFTSCFIHDHNNYFSDGVIEINSSDVEFNSTIISDNYCESSMPMPDAYQPIYIDDSNVLFNNSTIIHNSSTVGWSGALSGAIYTSASHILLLNSIFYYNEIDYGADTLVDFYGDSTSERSIIVAQNCLFDTSRVKGNIAVDDRGGNLDLIPEFSDSTFPGMFDPDCDLVDAGAASLDTFTWFGALITPPYDDIFGNTRFFGDGYDIGAYEVQVIDSSDTTEPIDGLCGDISGFLPDLGDSSYYITCDLHIRPFDTLLIEAGADFIFTDRYSIIIDTNAVLLALGQESAHITFQPMDSILTDESGGIGGMFFNNSAHGCTLSYCDFTYGNAIDWYDDPVMMDQSGGAITTYRANPVILNSTFSHCRSDMHGGAIYIQNGLGSNYPVLQGCGFIDNTGKRGGAVCAYYAWPAIRGCYFEDNTAQPAADGLGGGFFVFSGGVSLEGNIFVNNEATNYGGAVGILNGSDINIDGNTFTENISWTGGALYLSQANCNFSGNRFDFNNAFYGAGIFMAETESFASNNIFFGNNADRYGGCIILQSNSELYGSHFTVVANQSDSLGAGILVRSESKAKIINSVFSLNTSTHGNPDIDSYDADACSLFFAYTNIDTIANEDSEGEFFYGDGIVDVDCDFIDPTYSHEYDLHIENTSSLISQATDDYEIGGYILAPISMDFDSISRPRGDGYDIGAYEYADSVPPSRRPEIITEIPDTIYLVIGDSVNFEIHVIDADHDTLISNILEAPESSEFSWTAMFTSATDTSSLDYRFNSDTTDSGVFYFRGEFSDGELTAEYDFYLALLDSIPTIVNNPPEFTNIPDDTNYYAFDEYIADTIFIRDIDGDEINYEILEHPDTLIYSTAFNFWEGDTSEAGLFVELGYLEPGTYHFEIAFFDEEDTIITEFTYVVAGNNPPEILTSIDTLMLLAGESHDVHLSVRDMDGDSLEYFIVDAPDTTIFELYYEMEDTVGVTYGFLSIGISEMPEDTLAFNIGFTDGRDTSYIDFALIGYFVVHCPIVDPDEIIVSAFIGDVLPEVAVSVNAGDSVEWLVYNPCGHIACTDIDHGFGADVFNVMFNCGANNKLDIIFCLDTTNTALDYIDDLYENLGAFSVQLDEIGFDSRFGLVTFGDLPVNAWDFDTDSAGIQMTSSIGDLLGPLSTISDYGGGDMRDCGYEALNSAMSDLETRASANKYIILISPSIPHSTDEGVGGWELNHWDVVDIANRLDFSISLVQSYVDGDPAFYPEELVTLTGGMTFEIGDEIFEDLFTDIFEILPDDTIFAPESLEVGTYQCTLSIYAPDFEECATQLIPITLNIRSPEALEYTLFQGWNLMSWPYENVLDVYDLFSTAYPPAYLWDAHSKVYVASDSMIAGDGYWLFFPEDTSLTIEESYEHASFYEELAPGWNLIGACSEDVPVDIIALAVPNLIQPLYEYNSVTKVYEEVDTLRPGIGYWILVSDSSHYEMPLLPAD